MKTRLFSLWLLLSVAVGLSAYDFEVDGLCYNITNDTLAPYTAEVTFKDSLSRSGTYSDMETANIPESVTYENKTYSVTSIRYCAFYFCRRLTSVTIPNSVTSIGYRAFEGCTYLTSITIPNSVTSIGIDAFQDTPWYDNQPDGVVYIGRVLYKYKGDMPDNTSIIVENGITCITSEAFQWCRGLTSITLPNSVTYIGSQVFYGCTNLTSIIIPNSVTNIGTAILQWCTNLTSIIVEADNPNYDSRNNCNAIIDTKSNVLLTGCQTTMIPNDITGIGWSAFGGCTGLTSVTIPNGVTSIEDYTFEGCAGLASVTIPNSVTSIGSLAFFDCTGLTSITIPNSVTSIGSYAFSGCTGLSSATIPNGVMSIEERTFADCTSLTSITIPNSVTSIGSFAFDGCTGLSSITIPNSVTSIGYNAFGGCIGLTSITIPNSVVSLSGFRDCTNLTSVTIPNSVTSIEGGAFDGCIGLTSITIPNRVTSIGYDAFYGCTGLASVTIPNSVTSIGGRAFYGCTGLDTVVIGNGITEIDNLYGSPFSNCNNIKYLQLGSGVKSIGNAFSDTKKLKQIVCYAVEPPAAEKSCFYNYNIHVQVPCDNLEDYETDVAWGSFKYLECIGADNADTDGKVIVTPSDNEVEITWPSDGNADTYSLVITQDGKEVCTLIFNSNGQLMRIAFAAPSRNGATRHAPAAVLTQSGYRFTVTGLNSGTQYAYAIDVKDKAGASLNMYKGTFTTTVNGTPTDVEDITAGTSMNEDAPCKVFRDGHVYILRGGKTYTTTGVEVE